MCAKIFQKLLFYKIFKFFIDNNLILLKKSCFKPGDCCTNQPLSITHDIYKSFDWGYETRGVFLEFLEALNKVWHNGTIFKLEQNGMSRKLDKLLYNFLVNRKQRVHRQVSSWARPMGKSPRGPMLRQMFVKIQSWAYYSLLSVSMT